MDERTQEERQAVRRQVAHRCAMCGRAVAMLSIVVLAKRLRDKRQERQRHDEHHRFPIFGH